MKQIDFSKFKNESYLQKLKQLASGTPQENMVFAFFGGTGAVGGQAAIEIIQAFDFIVSFKPEWNRAKPLLYITGLTEDEVYNFRTKLFKAFHTNSGHGFDSLPAQDSGAIVTLTRKSGVTIELHKLAAEPKFVVDLKSLIEGKSNDEIIKAIEQAPTLIKSPFEAALQEYVSKKQFGANFRFQSVISGIPIPSVAAYHFAREIDKVLVDTNVKKNDANKEIERAINIKVLHGFADDFGQIKDHLANEVLIAHTTSVGGMFTIENKVPVIRLGYAHSALDEQLKEKQFYANELTRKYSELGLKILITAAAIGIDNVYTNDIIPINKGIFNKYQIASQKGELPFPDKFLDKKNNYIFTPLLVSPGFPIPKDGLQKKLAFEKDDKNSPPKLRVAFGLRSGENGIFSIDNAYALYYNMKIATQEELAHILAFSSLFSDDHQKPWFDKDGICYQTESENSNLVFALLNNRAEFRAYQVSGFTPKAFQDLGSAKHQCELHTLGLYMLLHRLKNLNPKMISDRITSKYREQDVIEFVDKNTEPLTIENIVSYDPIKVADDFTKLLTLESHEQLAKFVGFDAILQEGFVKTFFQQLFNAVRQTIFAITSLGTPIVFEENGETRILAGPYCAAIDTVISHNDTFAKYIKDESIEYHLNNKDCFEWVVCNNGVIDLRPQATITTAKSHKNGLKGEVKVVKNLDEFRSSITDIQEENNRRSNAYGYFTTSGVVSFVGRLTGLHEQLKSFDISLGTFNTWKALFHVDSNLHHPVIPGLIEAMRMYSEGLGKVTGFELLYPGFGYYKN